MKKIIHLSLDDYYQNKLNFLKEFYKKTSRQKVLRILIELDYERINFIGKAPLGIVVETAQEILEKTDNIKKDSDDKFKTTENLG
jgi:stalled ribosome rescue protein Dom34